jgi:hypothetical protein
MLTTQQLSRIFLPLSFSKRSNSSASLYEIINSYLKLFPTNKIVVNTSAPAATVTAGAAAGTTPTLSISGNKYAGTITVTTGTSAATGVLATIDLKVMGANANRVVLFPADADAAAASAKIFVDSTTSGFTINVTGSALANSTAHIWNYVAFNA